MTLTALQSKERNLGDFSVRRVLPDRKIKMVGPFIFFDHFGPVDFPPGKGINVRPHPHIGIATMTYLFNGSFLHRDSLGFVQPIEAGAVNLMTAGKGIVHSERAGDDIDIPSSLHGIQSWIALPRKLEDCEPAFHHYAKQDIPKITHNDVTIKVVIGEAFDQRSPVQSFSPTIYLDCFMPAGKVLELPTSYRELAVYVVSGSANVNSDAIESVYSCGSMLVSSDEDDLIISAESDCQIIVAGGEPVGERLLWWNFVASNKVAIEAAKERWKSGLFGSVPGDNEYIPLPE